MCERRKNLKLVLIFIFVVFCICNLPYLWNYLLNPPEWVKNFKESPWKDFTAILQSIGFFIQSVTSTAAIFIGGILSYNKFFRQREFKTRASIKHIVNDIFIDEQIILRCQIAITNLGEGLLVIESASLKVSKLVLTSYEKSIKIETNPTINWEEIDEGKYTRSDENVLTIESRESDSIDFEFLLNSKIKIIELESKVQDSKNQSYRIVRTIHELTDKHFSQNN